MSEFEKQVRHALIDRDMTMTDLANELGITISYVSDLLKGKRTNQEQLQRIKDQHLVDGTQVWLRYLFLWELITFQDWWLQVFFTSPTKLNQVHWKAKQDGKVYAENA